MNSSTLPILYTFRRCPYAMRARLAIAVSEVQVEMREVILSDKPKELLECSAKATVPVLQLTDKTVIDESFDIMLWALSQHDPEKWLSKDTLNENEMNRLIGFNDNEFKQHLDKYKYASRFPEEKMEYYREQGELFLELLEKKLNNTKYLLSDSVSLADMAIFPFIRQFAYVDIAWFEKSRYKKLRVWLSDLLDSQLFKRIMKKYPRWEGEN